MAGELEELERVVRSLCIIKTHIDAADPADAGAAPTAQLRAQPPVAPVLPSLSPVSSHPLQACWTWR